LNSSIFVASSGVNSYWHFLTRLGEMQNLIPAALLACLILVRQLNTRSFAFNWIGALALAAFLTTASKVAFIGWGIGFARWNFTGISGHAMFAAAVYPLLAVTLASRFSPAWQKLTLIFSVVLVVLVGVSRVVVGAHSGSEVLAGLLMGALVVASVLLRNQLAHAAMSYWVPAIVVIWLMLAPVHAPQLPTHALVTRLALYLSGHPYPYTRLEMLRSIKDSPAPVAGTAN
jgi:membrane-associated phospholipid phosphatase